MSVSRRLTTCPAFPPGLRSAGPEVKEGRVCADDVFYYDPIHNKWSRVVTRLGPLPKRSHTITLLTVTGQECAVAFGGLHAGQIKRPRGYLSADRRVWDCQVTPYSIQRTDVWPAPTRVAQARVAPRTSFI
jgi:hypothetical protein